MPYYVAAQKAAAARAAAVARQMELWKNAQNSTLRLAAADKARARGDILLAARIYNSLARSQAKNAAGKAARQKLAGLAEEARRKLAQTDSTLETVGREMSPSDWRYTDHWSADLQQTVMAAFREYETIVDNYGAVASVKRELEVHLTRQRRHPEYSTVLNEPEAEALLQLARQHEEEDQQCCAYWVYEEAAKLEPAPSARVAARRYAEMNRNAETVAAAEQCRQLQWCHRKYKVADQLVDHRPDDAREWFTKIADLSPPDTEIHQAAQSRLAELLR
jgi:hypothetical protein